MIDEILGKHKKIEKIDMQKTLKEPMIFLQFGESERHLKMTANMKVKAGMRLLRAEASVGEV